MTRTFWTLLAVASLAAAMPAAAQQKADGASSGGLDAARGAHVSREPGPGTNLLGVPAAARAVRLEGELAVDGRLDDPAWQTAPEIGDFVQGEPIEGATPAEPTNVRVLFDDHAIYIGARLHERHPEAIHDQLVRRDERGSFDHFAVSLDPNLDGLTGYEFTVAASGQKRDAFLFGDVQEDEDWNAVWDAAVEHDEDGWTVEIRIPLSQIRYEGADGEQTWGVNFERRRLESNETDYFALQSRTVRGKVSQFGTIDGLHVPGAGRRIELRPFAVSQYNTAPSESGNPLTDGTEWDPRFGTDVSVGIGSAFSLDATFNPDFGQVEVDPEVINLTAFETFFPEKRPFFVQDARVFEFAGSQGGRGGRGGKNMFFSRRIGREPQGSGPDGASFTDSPSQNTILGAAKLTGRTSSGLSVGALAAVTAKETGRAYFAAGDSLGDFVAQPAATQGVVRLKQDFRDGGSSIGVIGTAITRGLPGDGAFDFLPSDAYSFGLDFDHQWGGSRGRDWRVWGFYAGSLVRGSTDAITRLQRNSIHYFQRPDASYLGVDSTATSMFGSDWRLTLERQSALHWTWSVWLGEQTPGFDINDLGFITSGERIDVGARIGYRQIQPGRLFRNYNISLFSYANFRHSLIDEGLGNGNLARSYETGSQFLSFDFTFLNNWNGSIHTSWSPQSLSDSGTRGGPLMTSPGRLSLSTNLNTDRRSPVSLRPSFSYVRAARDHGHDLKAGLGFTFRPAANWELTIGPGYGVQRNSAQYVSATDAVDYEPTFGTRYLFGDLLRKTISMDTRLNVAFSTALSLQLYVQPLISSGDYRTYRQLAAPESFDFIDFPEGAAVDGGSGVACVGGLTCQADDVRYFDFNGDGEPDYSTSERDFNIRSLRGNAVLRWEYRPGSELFLVWQHSRRDTEHFGDLRLSRDFDGLFSAPSENVFIVKLSQYLSF